MPRMLTKPQMKERLQDAIQWIAQQHPDGISVADLENELRRRGWWPMITADGAYFFQNEHMPVHADGQA